MPVFKNVSGVDLEVSGRPVGVDAEIDAAATLLSESDDAYFTTTGKEVVVGKDNEGNPVKEKEVRAWPKATWNKVSKFNNEPAPKEDADEEGN